MPSKFPGMDPYLERDALWPDVHNAFCLRLRAALNCDLPPGYVARVEERLIVEASEYASDSRGRQRIGDVTVGDVGREVTPNAPNGSTGVTVAVEIPVLSEPKREVYIEIRDSRTGDLVTLIEILSPTNKRPNSHRNEFLQNRDEILQSTIHYVEIDLLRGSERLPINGLPDCEHYVLVRRGGSQRKAEIYPIQLTDSLPNVAIPLRAGESIAVNFQTAFDQTFDEGRYAPHIYQSTPDPPLTPVQLAWVESLSSS